MVGGVESHGGRMVGGLCICFGWTGLRGDDDDDDSGVDVKPKEEGGGELGRCIMSASGLAIDGLACVLEHEEWW